MPFHPRVEQLEDRWVPTTVTNLNDSGMGSLRQAIIDTLSGGIVDFEADLRGTITLTTAELAITKDLTIAGPGADVITVSGNRASRVFNIGAAFTVDISGMTIANGRVTNANGGGILNSGMLTVTNSTLSGNSAEGGGGLIGGGGIFNWGTLTVTSSTLSGNSADAGDGLIAGGGILNLGTLTVTSSTLSGNSGSGGGIANGGTLTVTNSTLTGNSASGGQFEGGGIWNTGTVTVTNSTLSRNSAPFFGGGILNNGTLTVTGSTLSGNFGGIGGGIANFNGTLTVINSTLSGNFSPSGGGGMANSNGTLTVTSSTLSGNSSSGGAGGISISGGVTHSRNTIIAGNTSPTAPDLEGNLGSQGHNLIGNAQGGSGFDDTDLLNVDPLLGPLQDNGGPTFTMALLPGSPAIDAGDNTDAPDWDQRGPGFPRIVGIIDPDNPVIDIGAFEVQQEGGSGPGRSVPTSGEPFRLDVATFLSTAISPSQSLFSTTTTHADALTKRALPASEVAILDRLFASLQKGDGRLALSQPLHHARAEANPWALDAPQRIAPSDWP
jgi:hypothetical protein